MIRIATVILGGLLVGCTPSKVIITPDKLPDVIVGEPYYTKIIIHINKGHIGSFDAPITPSDSGLSIDVCNPADLSSNALNCIIIQGITMKLTDITINISGSLISSHGLFYKKRKIFDKTYVIKVKEKAQAQ